MSKRISVAVLLLVALAIAACSNPFQRAQATATARPTATPNQVATLTVKQNELAQELAYSKATISAMEQQPAPQPEKVVTATPVAVTQLQPAAQTVEVTPTSIVVASSATDQVNTQVTPIDAPTGHEICPSDREMQDAHGFTARGFKPVFTGEGVVWDPCKWTLQANGAGIFENVPLLPGYAYNITLPDDTVVIFYGAPNLILSFKGATIRYVKALPDDHFVRNACSYIAEEMAFGLRRDPQYMTEMGNVNCPDMAGFNPMSCPENAVHAAALIGGQPQYWTMATESWGADVYMRKEHWTKLHYPGFGSLDVWYNGGPVTITGTQNTNVLLEVNPDEASFHCP